MIRNGAIALLLFLVGPLTAAGQTGTRQSRLEVRADTAAGGRAVLAIGDVLDDDALEQAVLSGLPLRVNVRVELWRDGFFDDLEASHTWTTVLLFEPLERQFLLRAPTGAARRFQDFALARAAVEAEYPLELAPRRPGRYYFTAALEIETLSLSDLDELERWLRGELGPAVSGQRSIADAMGEGAKRLLIRLLGLPSRRVEAKSEPFRVQ